MSLQQASFEKPRVVVTNPFADIARSFSSEETEKDRVFLAYNGDSTHSGFEKLEIIQYRARTAQFHFSEISLTEEGPTIEENPRVCSNCHGDVGRPIWGPYANWPGS